MIQLNYSNIRQKAMLVLNMIGVMLLLQSCVSENPDCPSSKRTGNSVCDTNYKPWDKGSGFMRKIDGHLELFMVQYDRFCNAESMKILLNKINLGKTSINYSSNGVGNFPNSIFSISNGDLQSANFDLKKDFDNYIDITFINSDTTMLKGTFQLAYVIPDNSTSNGHPDTLYFTNGRFDIFLIR